MMKRTSVFTLVVLTLLLSVVTGADALADEITRHAPDYYKPHYQHLVQLHNQEIAAQGYDMVPLGSESVLLPVTPIEQIETWWCGPASLQMVIKYVRGTSPSQAELATYTKTTELGGAIVLNMVSVLNDYVPGYKHLSLNDINFYGTVKRSLQNNRPAIYHLKTRDLPGYNGSDYGHYVVGNGAEFRWPDDVDPDSADILGPPTPPEYWYTYVDPWGPVLGQHRVSADVMELSIRRNAGLIISQ